MKKIILSVSVLILICGSMVFAGGGGDSSSSDTDITIQFLANETPILPREFWQTVADRYHAENPNVTVEMLYQPASNITVNQHAKTLLATGQFPDITVMTSAPDYVPSGALLEFDEADVDILDPSYVHKIEGGIYVVPYKIQTAGVWYNKDMFSEYGYEVPTTWDEFIKICEGFEAAGIPANVMGLKDGWAHIVPFNCILTAELLKNDPDWPQKRMNSEDTFARNEYFMNGVEKFALLMSDYNVSDKSSMTYAQSNETFFNEESPMYIMGSWMQGMEMTTDHDFEVGYFPIPTDDGESIIPLWAHEGLSISSKTKYPEVAKDFVRFFLEDEVWAAQFLASEQLFSPLKDPVTYDATRLHDEVVVSVAEGRGIPNISNQVGDNTWIPGVIDLLSRTMLNISLGGNIDENIDELDKEFDKLLENYAE